MHFHSTDGKHFLGVRTNRRGEMEVVYDREGRRRVILKLETGPDSPERIAPTLARVVNTGDVLGQLAAGLRAEGYTFDLSDEGTE